MRKTRCTVIVATLLLGTLPAALAESRLPWPVVDEPAALNSPSNSNLTTGAIDPQVSPIKQAIGAAITAQPMGPTDEDKADDTALKAFYNDNNDGLLWISDTGFNDRGRALIAEIKNGDAWGLDPTAFVLPKTTPADKPLSKEQQARLEVQLTRAALLYARHARGGRIMSPSKMLNSHLNRAPQLLPPQDVLRGLADADDAARYLVSLHPQHDQFQKLRRAYLSVRAPSRTKLRLKRRDSLNRGQTDKRIVILRKRLGRAPPSNNDNPELFDAALEAAVRQFQDQAGVAPADGSLDFDTARALNKRAKASADVLKANMEQWRWMWDDLGDVHVLANIPEYMLSLKKNGETLYRERVVVGQVSKQSSIFSRTLKHIVLRPMWRVPESIKVRELWPSLKRGGGLMRSYGLQLETKDGKPVNYRRLNWHKEDIRNYEVVQPPGRKSVMGKVKFSFPSQHTIFIHDTPDKYMFRYKRRTLSHGCLRLRNPVKLAHLLLDEDKGWDAAHINELIASGPNRNAIKIETRIPIHLVYFTAWVQEDGRVTTFRDIYGHEKRIRQALNGQWSRIAKGRDHLAPPQPVVTRRRPGDRRAARNRATRPSDYINRAITGGFF
ncbi:MAG: L,D-transpeptidase family protein [Alphaproteobacteria bacterium]|nr:L,D-transpeptidase family protein [Alphaproteobacteria bacterium]